MAITSDVLNTRFFQVIDEVATDEFLPEQVSGFFTMAQDAIFKKLWDPDHIGEKPGATGYDESAIKISEYLSPFRATLAANVSSGFLAAPFVFSNVPAGQSIAYIVSMSLLDAEGNGGAARWISRSEFDKINKYSILKPEICNPCYMSGQSGYYALPQQSYTIALAEALLTPPVVDINGGIGSSFPESLTNALVFKACEFAGISIRDEAFVRNVVAQMESIGV